MCSESHHATVVLLEPERLNLKLQSVVLRPRQEPRVGACQLTVKQTPECNTEDRKRDKTPERNAGDQKITMCERTGYSMNE